MKEDEIDGKKLRFQIDRTLHIRRVNLGCTKYGWGESGSIPDRLGMGRNEGGTKRD